jgi:hypothetical protein
MDPFTEDRFWWKGIHGQLIGELSNHLLPPLLAPAYYVDTDTSLQIGTGHSIYPDVQVNAGELFPSTYPQGLGLPIAPATTTLTVELALEEDEETYGALFVREAIRERLVAVIEVLSYSNKTKGDDKYAYYLARREELLLSGVHLVEIDLLRWGQRVVSHLSEQPYHILVTRGDEPNRMRVWSFGFDTPIPTAPLPLIGKDEYVPIPLQEAYQTVYDARSFRRRLNYKADPPEPLTPQHKEQIHACLTAAGLR